MKTTSHKKMLSSQISEPLPQMKIQLDSEVKRILQDLSLTKENNLRKEANSLTESIFALKMAKYDSETL